MLNIKRIRNLEEYKLRRKITALFVILLIVITSLPGCSKKGKDQEAGQLNSTVNDGQTDNGKIKDKSEEPTMGRYMEEEVALPELSSNERIIKILENADKQMEIYTLKSGDEFGYFCYQLQEDMTWKRNTPGWLNDGEAVKNKSAEDICLGMDGNYYASFIDYSDNNVKSYIIKSEDSGKTAGLLKIPYLEKETQILENYHYYPSIEKMRVLKDGSLVLYDRWETGSLHVYSEKEDQLDKLSIGDEQNFITSDEDIITVNEDGTGVIFYDPALGKAERTIDFNNTESANAYALKEDGTLILGNSGGIHRLPNNGTLWETVVDGSLNSMSMPSLQFNGLFVREGEQEEYYAVYTNNDSGYELMHYVFNEKVASVPEKEITVYSLKENKTIRQAISLYQAENSDTKVNYVVAMGDEGGNVSDYIRALNTELLAGNGADVLVLDGLPVDSYIEKGVLSDITDIMNPLEQSGEVLSNISDYYHKDGKVYEMPLRFSIPVIAGKTEAIKAAVNTDSIVKYIKQTNIPYSESTTYQALLQDYSALYSRELFQNGELNEESFTLFLRNMKIIAENIKASENDENSINESIPSQLFFDKLFLGNVVSLQKKVATSTEQVKNIMGTMLLFEVLKDKDIGYQSINQMYIPSGAVGLNSKSGETDIAKKFIGFLFGEKVQDTNLYDGFPVNAGSMKKWIAEDNADFNVTIGDAEGYKLSAEWPKKEEREAFLTTVMEVKIPIETNQILLNMIVEEAVPFLKGETDESQVVAAVKTKVNTYLAE